MEKFIMSDGTIKIGSSYFELFKTYLKKIGLNDEQLENITKAQALDTFQKADKYDGSVDGKASNEFFIQAIKELYNEQVKLEDDINVWNEAWKELSGDDGILTTEEVELDNPEPVETPKSQPQTQASSPSSTNGWSGTPSSSSSSTDKDSVKKKSLDKMSVDELAEEMNSAGADFNKKQTKLSEIQTGKNSGLSEAQKNMDDSYNAYEEAIRSVDSQLADEVASAKADVDLKQAAVNENEALQLQQSATVDICQVAYDNADSALGDLKSRLDELNGVEDDKNGTIAEKISYLQGEISNAEQVKSEAEKALNTAKEELETTVQEREKLDSDLEQAEKVLAEAEAKIPEDNPTIKAAKDAWEQSKTAYNQSKDTMLAAAKKEFDEAKDYVNEVQTAKISAEKEQILKNASPNAISDEARKKLEEAARNVIGRFGLCLGGVSHSLKKIYEGKCLDGLKSAYMARDALRGDIPGYEDIASHFTEVEVAREDLINLPSGYIVVFDKSDGLPHGHIFITLGNGWESSDHIDRMGILGSPHTVFAPISL